ITNKLRAASKRPQNKDLKRWMEKVTNHVYWCAAIGNGDGQVVLDAWKTITRHIINVHDGHEGSISRCMHGPLHNKLWLNAEYISTLMTNVLERLERLPSFREAASELSTPPPPPPMIARVQPRPSKADLVAVHKSRFGKA
ncbi:uncharacterized protein ISCGN_030188, partial [Ixodes scapularis]